MREYQLPDYLVSGEGDTTVYLLHGAYGSKEYWRYTVQRLNAAGYRTVAWDAPGYGTSDIPDALSITGMAELAGRLIDATGSKRNAVLGHSMGGLIAQKVADLHPGRLQALVLSATVHTFNHSGPEWQDNFLRTRVAPLTQGRAIREYAPDLLRTMMGPGASGEIVDHVLYNVMQMNGQAFQKAIQATAAYLEDDVPARLTLPTLCIAGELDITCPPNVMAHMAEILPQGEYHMMAGVGHYGWAERPDEYHDVLLDFLQRHMPAR